MGQKVNPVGIRLGIVKDWDSKWYASSKDYSEYLLSDIAVRDFLFKELTSASVSRISLRDSLILLRLLFILQDLESLLVKKVLTLKD